MSKLQIRARSIGEGRMVVWHMMVKVGEGGEGGMGFRIGHICLNTKREEGVSEEGEARGTEGRAEEGEENSIRVDIIRATPLFRQSRTPKQIFQPYLQLRRRNSLHRRSHRVRWTSLSHLPLEEAVGQTRFKN